jgi:hypothetical protein
MPTVCSSSYTPPNANYTSGDGGECYVDNQSNPTANSNAVYDAAEVADAIRNHYIDGASARHIWDEMKEFGGNILDRVEDNVRDLTDSLINEFVDTNSY